MVRTFSLCVALSLASGTLAQEPVAILKHDGWVAAVAFAPDGKTLASAGADNVVRLWEVGTWKPKGVVGVVQGHTDCVCSVAFSPDSTLIATGSYDHTWQVRLVGNTGYHATGKLKGAVNSVVFGTRSPIDTKRTSTHLHIGCVDGSVRSHDLERLPPITDNPDLGHRSWVNGLAIDPITGILASGSSDGTIRVRFRFTPSPRQEWVLEGGAGEVRCVAFSPDGKLLAAGNRYHTVRVWDALSRKELVTLTGHMSDVWSIAFSPDGKTLAAADTDWKKPSKVKLWDTATWKQRGTIEVPGEILSIAYSPKGDWLAVGSWDKTVRVFAVGK